ncbi:hypothetical protein LOC68_17015 [Blastopirellula sp. JC732]|uniref:Prolow-density lipoprotein receptor-related protein 1-like beta-propeller domain-containing protein n=1 Tax=Blastopirellula sediminis TaxID=2894196 RepID=A0A9X1MNM5_9BACT|nr:hypothetical protein [Blastopirellula sediminis]MCC9606607.1 hypothetical protein [Blastopirellula sediminis]MCC9630096.1 hypothetical protein [Blastopirellula sediminis]
MSQKPVRNDRALASHKRRRHASLHAEQLEVRQLLAADLSPLADLVEGEAVLPTVDADAKLVARQSGTAANNSGVYAGDVATLSASLGEVVDNGDGTWSWSFDTRLTNVGTYDVRITAADALANEATTTFSLTVHNYGLQLFDVHTGEDGVNSVEFVTKGDYVYFTGIPLNSPRQLFRTDGVSAPKQISDLPGDDYSYNASKLVVVGDTLYYLARSSGGTVGLWKTDGTPGQTEKIADLPWGDASSFVFRSMAYAGGYIYLRNLQPSDVVELWKVNVETGQFDKVADVTPGSPYFTSSRMVSVGDVVYFFANDGDGPLWRSDGTAEGTYKVESTPGVYVTKFTQYDDSIFFVTNDGATSSVWRIDASGVSRILQTTPTVETNWFGGLRTGGDHLLFAMNRQGKTGDVWSWNETTEEMELVANLIDLGFNLVSSVSTYDGLLYVRETVPGTTKVYDQNLWRTDGTPAGTFRLIGESELTDFYVHGYYATDVGFFMLIADAVNGYELWTTDGTVAGTYPTTEWKPSHNSIPIREFQSVGQRLIMGLSVSAEYGDEIYTFQTGPTVDISAPSNGLVGDVLQLDAGATFDTIDAQQDLTFEWDVDGDGDYGDASGLILSLPIETPGLKRIGLRVTDKEGAATYAVSTIQADYPRTLDVNDKTVTVDEGAVAVNSGTLPLGSFTLTASLGTVVDNQDGSWSWSFLAPNGPVAAQNVIITATDSQNMAEQVEFDLIIDNVAPTVAADLDYLIAEVGQVAENSGTLSDPGEDAVVLSASAGQVINNGDGTWSWSLDSTLEEIPASVTITADDGDEQAETTFTIDRWDPQATRLGSAAPFAINAPISDYLLVGDLYYFISERSLWRTDGTAAGTIRLLPASSNVQSLFDYQGTLVISTASSLYKSDGTVAGTQRIRNIRVIANSFHDVNGTLLFFADDLEHGYEPFTSDLTTDGTKVFIDVNEGSERSIGNDHSFQASDGTLYFLATTEETGLEMWKSDGTVDGTMLIKDIYDGPESGVWGGTRFVELNGEVYFTAQTDVAAQQFWKTDGTAEGTKPAHGQTSEYVTFSTKRLTDGQYVYYVANDYYFELRRTDGTPNGSTTIPLNLPTGRRISDLVTIFHGEIYFTSYSSEKKTLEVWKLDATTGNSVYLADVGPYSFRYSTLEVGEFLYFRAYDATYGMELWRTDGTPAGTERLTEIVPDNDQVLQNADAVFDFKLLGNRVTTRVYNVNDSPEILDTWFIEIADPTAAADQPIVTTPAGNIASAGGTYQYLMEGIIRATASIGDVVVNGDGTWSWSYDAVNNPLESQLVTISLTDGVNMTEASFTLNVLNLTVDHSLVAQEPTRLAQNVGRYADFGDDQVALSTSLGMVINNGDGTWSWSYTPSLNEVGQHEATITADNGAGGVVHTTFTLDVLAIPEAALTLNAGNPVTDGQGQVATLPPSFARIDEWDSLTANVWIRRPARIGGSLTNVTLDLHFSNLWYLLESFVAGSGVGQLQINNVGDTLKIDASQFTFDDAALDAYLLVGSFHFRPNPHGGVANNLFGAYPTPLDSQFSLSNILLSTDEVTDQFGLPTESPETTMQVVPYDLDDDGVIGLIDLSKLISKLGTPVASNPALYPYDFDQDGNISLIDLVYMIRNVGTTRDNDAPISFPTIFVPPNPLVETESLAIQTSASVLLEGEAIPLPLPTPEENNFDAAFGNLSLLEECWEAPTEEEEEEEVETAFSFPAHHWQPEQLPDWALQASTIVDCVVEKALSILDDLEEEHPRFGQAINRLKSRLQNLQ